MGLENITQIKKDLKWAIEQIRCLQKRNSNVIEQDNIFRVLNVINATTVTDMNLFEQVIATINSSLVLTIKDTENYLVVFNPNITEDNIESIPPTYKFIIKNLGKNVSGENYGLNGIPLTVDNIELIYVSPTVPSDIIDENTQFINIEDLGLLSISDYVNQLVPPIQIQNLEDGTVIFNVGTGVDKVQYWFVAEGGLFGLDNLQTIDDNFVLLNQQVESFTLTTLNQIGAATLLGNILNIPRYDLQIEESILEALLAAEEYTDAEIDALDTQDLRDRVSDLEYPDIVLENGIINLDGLDLEANGYKWRLNQVEFLSPTPFSTTLVAATDNYFRYDLLQGDATGNYSIKQGIEDITSADIPSIDADKIALAVIAIEGDTVVAITPPDLTSLEARVTDLENRIPIPANGFTSQATAVWSGTGLIYNVTTSTYYLNGILYPAIVDNITLDSADGINPRIDSIVADINGLNKEPGIAEVNPVSPTLDPNTQLLITDVLILAGATTPANTSQSLIYDEGVEWNTFANHGNITFNNTTDPLNGTYCINVANSVGNTYFELDTGVLQNIIEADGFKYWNRPISTLFGGRGWKVQFFNGTTPVSNEIVYKRPVGGGPNVIISEYFTDTSKYHLQVIPYTALDFSENFYNKVRFTFIGTISMKFDYIALMSSGGGFGTAPEKKAFSKIITDDGIASATTAEDSIVLTGKNGTEVKAIGKTISIDAGQLNVIWHKFPWTDTGDITISGTTVTSTAGIFEADMIGAKIKVGDLDFIISSYSSATSVQVVSNPYGTVTGPNGSWGVYNKAIEVTTGGSLNLYGTSSNIPATMYSESTMILPNLVHTIGSLIGITADSFQLTSEVPIVWRSGDLATDGSRDVGIRRNAAGVLEVFDGITAGQYRDMVVRNISGVTATAPEHYVPLAQMEAADADTLAAANAYTDSKVTSVYRIKPSVADFASLPSSGNVEGDTRNTLDTGMNYVWDGTVWDAIGTTVDISGKEDITNKSNDIEADKTSTTKYGSIKAFYDWAVGLFAKKNTPIFTGEVTMSNYPSTRNDGALPTNKVLSVNAAGKVGLYAMAVSPAPWIRELIPDSYLPSTTGNIRILGDFFTPAMCDRVNNPNAILLGGVTTIHYATFVSSQEILINVTTGTIEGYYSLTLDNGLSTTKSDALLIVLGTVFKPNNTDWTSKTNIETETEGEAHVLVYNSTGSAIWSKILDNTKNYSVRFKIDKTPLGPFAQGFGGINYLFQLINESDSTVRHKIGLNYNSSIRVACDDLNVTSNFPFSATGVDKAACFASLISKELELRKIGTTVYFYIDNVLKYTSTDNVTQDLKIQVIVKDYNLKNIKYIELAT